MKAKLVPIAGAEGMDPVSLAPDKPAVLGRSASADVQLLQDKVSRTHCRIAFEKGFYSVEDLESKNGTWVNDRRIERAILFHHDRISVGSTEFRFELESGISEDSSIIKVDGDRESVFHTEVREPVVAQSPSSILMEMSMGMPLAEAVERDLAAVYEVINKINAEHHLDRLLESLMDSVMHVTTADRGYLIAAKTMNGVLMPLVSRNKDTVPRHARNTFSRSIISEAYNDRCCLLLTDPTSQYDISESIVSQQIQSIMCVPMCDTEGALGVIYVDRIQSPEQFSKRDLKVLSAIANQAAVAIRRAQLTQQIESLFRDVMRTVINLVEVKDEYTYGHSERVTAMSLLLAELYELDKVERRTIELAGLLHDVGKLGVEPAILQKPARLTDSEYTTIQQHPAAGARILRDIENAEPIADAVRHHHERWDGKGYPEGIAGEDIPLAARVLGLADAFDSMAADRPYRKALGHPEVVAELKRCSGTQFDPDLIERFLAGLDDKESFPRRIAEIYRRKNPQLQFASPVS